MSILATMPRLSPMVRITAVAKTRTSRNWRQLISKFFILKTGDGRTSNQCMLQCEKPRSYFCKVVECVAVAKGRVPL